MVVTVGPGRGFDGTPGCGGRGEGAPMKVKKEKRTSSKFWILHVTCSDGSLFIKSKLPLILVMRVFNS